MNNDPVFLRIEELRKQKKVTQTELISRLGMARGTYFHWKHGDNLSYHARISDISKILQVSSGLLIDGPGLSPEDTIPNDDANLFDEEELVQIFHKLDSDKQKAFMTILRALCTL